MKPTDFANALTDFLGRYLTVECGYSQNTVTTYSYTFSLFIEYMEKEELVRPEKLTFNEITKDRIIHFLAWLEKDRKCSPSTRNARLGALHSFFSYLQYRNVAGMAKWQDILSIKCKKPEVPEEISGEEIAADQLSETQINTFGLLAKRRIEEAYRWESIVSQYQDLFHKESAALGKVEYEFLDNYTVAEERNLFGEMLGIGISEPRKGR